VPVGKNREDVKRFFAGERLLLLYSLQADAFLMVHGSEDGNITLPDGYRCPPIRAVEQFHRWSPSSLTGVSTVYVLTCHSSHMKWGKTNRGIRVQPVIRSHGPLWMLHMNRRSLFVANFDPGNRLDGLRLDRMLSDRRILKALGKVEKQLHPERRVPYKLYNG